MKYIIDKKLIEEVINYISNTPSGNFSLAYGSNLIRLLSNLVILEGCRKNVEEE